MTGTLTFVIIPTQASASEECPPNDVGDGARQAREAASNGPDNAPASVANPASEEVVRKKN